MIDKKRHLRFWKPTSIALTLAGIAKLIFSFPTIMGAILGMVIGLGAIWCLGNLVGAYFTYILTEKETFNIRWILSNYFGEHGNSYMDAEILTLVTTTIAMITYFILYFGWLMEIGLIS